MADRFDWNGIGVGPDLNVGDDVICSAVNHGQIGQRFRAKVGTALNAQILIVVRLKSRQVAIVSDHFPVHTSYKPVPIYCAEDR